jgi:hypothetical protein
MLHSSYPFNMTSLAFRSKIRTDALEAQSEPDPNVYMEKTMLAYEIAQVLRKNVVQARKVEGAMAVNDVDIWRM